MSTDRDFDFHIEHNALCHVDEIESKYGNAILDHAGCLAKTSVSVNANGVVIVKLEHVKQAEVDVRLLAGMTAESEAMGGYKGGGV